MYKIIGLSIYRLSRKPNNIINYIHDLNFMADNKSQNYIFKICLIGDPEVGKTSLVKRFVLDQFDGDYILTLGAKVMKKVVQINSDGQDYTATLLLWDIMGQKHFKIIESVALENVVGGLVVCDMTRKETFDNLKYWIESVWKISHGIPIIILGNKSDLQEEVQVTDKQMKEFSKKFTSTWYLTSAKTGDNVDDAFTKLAEYCLKGVGNE